MLLFFYIAEEMSVRRQQPMDVDEEGCGREEDGRREEETRSVRERRRRKKRRLDSW